MRPKKNIVVIGHQGELRCALRIALHVNVWPAEDMAQLKKLFARGILVDLIIIDRREAPILAKRAAQYCGAVVPLIKTIVVVSYKEPLRRGDTVPVMRDGLQFIERLFNSVAIGLARKRGPLKRYQPCPL